MAGHLQSAAAESRRGRLHDAPSAAAAKVQEEAGMISALLPGQAVPSPGWWTISAFAHLPAFASGESVPSPPPPARKHTLCQPPRGGEGRHPSAYEVAPAFRPVPASSSPGGATQARRIALAGTTETRGKGQEKGAFRPPATAPAWRSFILTEPPGKNARLEPSFGLGGVRAFDRLSRNPGGGAASASRAAKACRLASRARACLNSQVPA